MVGAAARREVVEQLKARHVSERRSCQFAGISRSGLCYRTRRRDEELCRRLREIASAPPRYGYRRACAVLRRNGERVNHNRAYRL